MVPKNKINAKEKWTLFGLTSLNGNPVMCIIIFAGKRKQVIYKTGMGIFCKQHGEVSDKYNFKNNSGKGKQYPMGPTHIFQGKEVPCLTRWSPNSSITFKILIAIRVTLDKVGCPNHSNGHKPFLLVDGHNSHFQLNFLRYAIEPTHKWAVYIDVPYGNALRQVGDSS